MPIAAHAQPVTGPYVNLAGGGTILNPTTYRFNTSLDTGRFQWKAGYTALGGIGFGFGDGFRVELDGDYLHNTVHKEDDSNGVQNRVFGAEKNYGGFLNGFYDATVPNFPLFPFIGGGVGYQQVTYDNPVTTYDAQNPPNFGRVFSAKWSFAYDVIAGLSYPIAEVPGLSVTAEYRFTQLVESRNFVTDNPSGRIHMGQESSHSALIGVRYQLFSPPPLAPAPTPAPTPMAAPAPAPAKTYLVFFDWDKYNLTPRALNIISQAAADSKTAQTTTISVSGYTDTSGTPKYNLGLSERRAKAVEAQLVADGVPESEIETHAFGETHLLVPTGPGVREPQNRRVEIVLQ
jgi:outer membrane protein OmpA-like peptidoglycan-associated protein